MRHFKHIAAALVVLIASTIAGCADQSVPPQPSVEQQPSPRELLTGDLIRREVAQEPGETDVIRLENYLTRLHGKTALPDLVRLTVANELNGQSADAIAALELAIADEPAEPYLYQHMADLLKKSADPATHLYVNGKAISADIIYAENRVLVPLATVGQAMEADVKWNREVTEVAIRLGANTAKLTLGSKTALLNEHEVALESPVLQKNGQTFVPLRFIAESFGTDVGWYPTGTSVGVVSIVRFKTE